MPFDQAVFAANVRRLAKDAGMSLSAVCRAAGLTNSTFKRLVDPEAQSVPSVDKVCEIAQVLGVSVDALVSDHVARAARREKKRLAILSAARQIAERDRLHRQIDEELESILGSLEDD